jgi:hypothetical protein
LCENLTFIGYLYEICSICDNMAICCLDSVSGALCAISKDLCSVSDGHYTKLAIVLFMMKKKGGTR